MAPESHNQRRMHIFLFFGYVFCCIVGLLWARIFYLQVIQANRLGIVSDHNFIRLVSVAFPRGAIVDTTGRILATNRPETNIYWHGTGNGTFTQHQREILEQLAKVIAPQQLKQLDQDLLIAERFEREIELVSDVPFAHLTQIAEQFCQEPNIIVRENFLRYYPHGSLAAHIIGYLTASNDLQLGRMGIEKLYQDELQGSYGITKQVVNSLGRVIGQEELQRGTPGRTVTSTIDLRIQRISEAVFPDNYAGCIVVMDPSNGAIRALVSRPTFDPGMFLRPIAYDEWEQLQNSRPFLNRAFEACYPPASVFKLVTASAALERGVISPEATCFCGGYIIFGNQQRHCNKRDGHGFITFRQALAKSCNILFFKIGCLLPVDVITDYAHRFGLGMPTGLSLPEKPGLIPSSFWKKTVKGERWWKGETLSVAIGQSYSSCTPIQITRMIASIFQGYLVGPRIIENEPISHQTLNIKNETLKFLRQCMKIAVEEGSARATNDIPQVSVYAKTGTAQVHALDPDATDSEGGAHKHHAWFACYFTCRDQKPLVMTIMLEHAGGSYVPARVARQFLLQYRNIMLSTQAPPTTPVDCTQATTVL